MIQSKRFGSTNRDPVFSFPFHHNARHGEANIIHPTIQRKVRILALIALYGGLLASCIHGTLCYFGTASSASIRPWITGEIALMILGLTTHSVLGMYRAPKLDICRIAALLFLLLGFGVGALAFIFPGGIVFFSIISILMVSVSLFLYSFIGVISMQAPKVTCPVCNHITKLLGMRDRCRGCAVILSLDPSDQQPIREENHIHQP
ncbi:DUF2614 family zinc ribbon-containing protein [Pasteuria penetrans]|uniref:DUF2614 family zinc ribbon-containing protein n=1 Tax=Pasteuria penetrans TaxID=86005 RepID=UPI0011ECA9AD